MTGEWSSAATQVVGRNLTQLVETTTIRGFHPYEIPAERLTELLNVPAFAQLTCFEFQLHANPNDPSAAARFYEVLAHAPALERMRHLILNDNLSTAGHEALAAAKSFHSLRCLSIRRAATESQVMQSSWFHRLTWLRIFALNKLIFARLADLPDLHTLDMPDFRAAIDPGVRFPALGRLIYGGAIDAAVAGRLAQLKLPRLAVFEAKRQGEGMRNDVLQQLLLADWFANLRSLNLQGNSIGDKGIVALGNHPAARQLREIRMGDNAFGKRGLATLAKTDAFPNLIVLDLDSSLKRKVVEADLAAFLSALAIPGLRCLNLNNWPLGNQGAIALAKNPAFANLERLFLDSCGIGDTGAEALVTSPHLQNLVDLHLDHNDIRTGTDALTDPAVMPRLGVCWLSGNTISKGTQDSIKKRRIYAIL
jgi:hypothetical protein